MQPMELFFSVSQWVCGWQVHVQQAAGGYAANECAADGHVANEYMADGVVV